MRRAYRPRLSKDKAVAQRVGEELKRERVQGFSVARQVAALGAIDDSRTDSINSSTPPAGAAPAAAAAAGGGASPSGAPGPSFTPTPTSQETRSRSQNKGVRRSATTGEKAAQSRGTSATAACAPSPTSDSTLRSTGSSPLRGAAGLSSTSPGTASSGSCWSCLSCSFENTGSSKKCTMCNTKNYRRAPRAAARDPGNGRGGLEPRRGPASPDSSIITSRTTAEAAKAGEGSAGRSADGGGEEGAVSLELGTGHNGTGRRKRRRNSTGAIANAGAGGAISTSTVAPGAAAKRRKRKSDGMAAPRTREGSPDFTAAADSTGRVSPPPARKRGLKRGRGLSATASSSPRSVVLPRPPTGGVFLSSPVSGDYPCRPPGVSGRVSIFSAPTSGLDGKKHERPTPTSRRQEAVAAEGQRLPFTVTPLTHEEDEHTGDAGALRTSASATASVASSSCAGAPPPACASPEEHSWPAVTRAASLDFSEGRGWEVSSVMVAEGNRHPPGADGGNGCGFGATIVVCHSGGVSIWALTDSEAICTHVSPALAGFAKENVRGSLCVAAVVPGDSADVTPSATGLSGGAETCIVAIGRHESDPGLPIIRMWRGSPTDAGHPRGRFIVGETAVSVSPPTVLTTTLKKKFSSFFPPVVARDVVPCLCVCGYSERKRGGGSEEAEDEGSSRQITSVMGLGGKVLRIICAAARTCSTDVRAKALPTGAVASGAVCTSLAPVPDNPFLVWASVPSSNAVLLWNVRELELLFTLPLTATSICVPAVVLPLSLAMREDGASTDGETAGSVSFERSHRREHSSRARRRDPRLLCMLTTGERKRSGDRGTPHPLGCGMYGVCLGGDGGGGEEPQHGCSVSVLRLDSDEVDASLPDEDIYERSCIARDGSSKGCLECLSDGNGFVAGVDRKGNVVARNVMTGEPRVLVTAKTPGGIGFASMDCNRSARAGILAVAVGGVDSASATTVDVYILSNIGDAPPAPGELGGDVSM